MFNGDPDCTIDMGGFRICPSEENSPPAPISAKLRYFYPSIRGDSFHAGLKRPRYADQAPQEGLEEEMFNPVNVRR